MTTRAGKSTGALCDSATVNVFNLRQALVDDYYSSFIIISFFRITDASVRQYGEPQLTGRLLVRHLLRQMAGSKSGAVRPEIIANG